MTRERQIQIYDTTLRDGAQAEDVSFTLEDKLRIAQRLDDFGVHYIEGGWPGSNPRDEAFFQRRARTLRLRHAQHRGLRLDAPRRRQAPATTPTSPCCCEARDARHHHLRQDLGPARARRSAHLAKTPTSR